MSVISQNENLALSKIKKSLKVSENQKLVAIAITTKQAKTLIEVSERLNKENKNLRKIVKKVDSVLNRKDLKMYQKIERISEIYTSLE